MQIKQKLSNIKQHKALTAGMAYAAGNLFLKGIAFLSIPIFTRLLSPADFGLYSVFVSYESILFLFVGLCLHTSIKAANIEFGYSSIDGYVSSILLLVFCSASIFYLLSWMCGNFFGEITGVAPSMLLLMTSQAISSAILSIYNNRISLDYNYKIYLLITAFSAIGNVVFSIILILTLFNQNPYMGRIWGTVIPVCLVAACLVVKQFQLAKPTFNRKFWKFGFWYSLPIIPHGFSQVVLAQFGRIMIQNMVGNAETGLYSFAFTIAMIPQIIATSLDTAWGPWFFERYRDKEISIIRHRANQYVIAFSVFTIMLAAISPEIIHMMAPKIYWDSVKIVIPAIAGIYFTFLYYLPASIEYYEKKTVYIAAGTILSGVLNITLTYVSIKLFGYVSAAYATAFTYAVNVGFHCIIAKRIAGTLPFNMKKMGLYTTITLIAMVLMCFALNNLILRETIFFIFLFCVLLSENISNRGKQ